MAVSDFEFRRPESAPTFYPNAQEFQQPLVYIAKIRSEAEKYGICKIKPPPVSFQFNYENDVEHLFVWHDFDELIWPFLSPTFYRGGSPHLQLMLITVNSHPEFRDSTS